MRRLNSLFNLPGEPAAQNPRGGYPGGDPGGYPGGYGVSGGGFRQTGPVKAGVLGASRLALQRARNISFKRWRNRAGLLFGLVSLVALTGVGVWTWQTGRIDVARIRLNTQTNALFAGLGLTLQDVEIRGKRQYTPLNLIRDAINANRGDSILRIDPANLRQTLLSLPWIKEIRVARQLPNTLVLTVFEHRPVAVWQHQGKRIILGESGHLIVSAGAGEFPDLPLLTGLGANEKSSALLDLVSAKPVIASRLQQAQLVRTRRWTLTLKNGLRIHLPEENPARALEHLTNLEKSDSLLSRDVLEIDMRSSDRIVIRTKPGYGQNTAQPLLKVIGLRSGDGTET